MLSSFAFGVFYYLLSSCLAELEAEKQLLPSCAS
jgi:hypothetical protein